MLYFFAVRGLTGSIYVYITKDMNNTANTQSIKVTRENATKTQYDGWKVEKYTQCFQVVAGSKDDGELHLQTVGLNAGFPAVLTYQGQGNWILEICNDKGWKKEFVRIAF